MSDELDLELMFEPDEGGLEGSPSAFQEGANASSPSAAPSENHASPENDSSHAAVSEGLDAASVAATAAQWNGSPTNTNAPTPSRAVNARSAAHDWLTPTAPRGSRAQSMPVHVPWPARYTDPKAAKGEGDSEDSVDDKDDKVSHPNKDTPQSVLPDGTTPTAALPFPRQRANTDFVPPHELAAMSLGAADADGDGWSYGGKRYTFSQIEGRGATLRGRGAMRAREAVMRQTGFLHDN